MTEKEMLKKVKRIKAEISLFDTGEKWVYNDSNLAYIDRKPINWAVVLKANASPDGRV